MKNEDLERQIIQVIATDRIEIPISSLSGKLKRSKPKMAGLIDLVDYKGNYKGERVYARVETTNEDKARSMKEAVADFASKYPKEGVILYAMIEERRVCKETYLYFGMNEGRKLSHMDYIDVMKGLGFSDIRSEGLYQELMEVSRNISKKRDEERSVLIGKVEK